MKTSCFKYYTGDQGVSICVYPPIDWTGCQYLGLAPDRQLLFDMKNGKLTKEQYEKLYRENTLSKQDPKRIYEMFKHNVLLCWESPGKFCHRRIVAKWIEENLGIEVLEWNPQDDIIINSKTNPLF